MTNDHMLWCDLHRRLFDNYMSRGCPDCEDDRIARRVIEMIRRDAVTPLLRGSDNFDPGDETT